MNFIRQNTPFVLKWDIELQGTAIKLADTKVSVIASCARGRIDLTDYIDSIEENTITIKQNKGLAFIGDYSLMAIIESENLTTLKVQEKYVFRAIAKNDPTETESLVSIRSSIVASGGYDSALSEVSQNAIQNAPVAKEFGKVYQAIEDTESLIKQSVEDVLGGASEAYDTLKEIEDYIEKDEAGAVALTQSIARLETEKVSKEDIDSALSTESENPVQNKVVTKKITELSYFLNTLNNKPAYEEGLLEMFIDPHKLPNISFLGMWCYQGRLYVSYKINEGDSAYLILGRSFETINNFERIELVKDNVAIGYVSFYDKSKFVDNPQSVEAPMNIRKVTQGGLADNSVTSEKLADNAIVPHFFAPTHERDEATKLSYEQGLYDVYIDNNKFPDITAMDMWNYQGRLYVRYKTDGDWVYFIQSQKFDTIEVGVPVDLIKDGIVVGHIVVKDKSKFTDYSRTYGLLLNMSVVTSNVFHNGFSPSGNADIIEISLPDRIYAVVGDTLQLFYRGIVKAVNPYNYDILVTCAKGTQYPRYYEFTPTSADIGTIPFKITIKDNNRNIISEKTCTIEVVDVASSPSSAKNVACFGDSLTSSGIWCAEAYRRISQEGGAPTGNALSNVNFVGAKKSANGAGFFGVGGWSWNSYVTEGTKAYRFEVSGVTSLSLDAKYTHNGNTFTIMEVNVTEGSGNILCSVSSLTPIPMTSGTLTKSSGKGDDSISFSSYSQDSANPLWDYDNGRMTFVPYAQKYADGKLDIVYTLLSWNGLSAGMAGFSSIISKVKIFADTLHAEFPDAKLKIMGVQVPSINGGMGANYGATGTSYADGYGMVVTALNMNKAYQDFANQDDYKSFVEFINVSSQFDSEYNMPSADLKVNTRSSLTERRGTNGVHPSNDGYMQIADIVYRSMMASL